MIKKIILIRVFKYPFNKTKLDRKVTLLSFIKTNRIHKDLIVKALNYSKEVRSNQQILIVKK